ncbi:alpha-1,2-fucosyltransferase [Flavobacterium sp. C3NV]|uniref:alpha-1,2-fucosyltransferase n=1 Tax=Flavobacterium sp. C3NV TaxID=3393358 RepID=UPI00398FE360
MIVVQLIGGLGNQLFQYAAAKALALETKQKLYLDVSQFESYKLHNYALNHFNVISKAYKKPNRYLRKIKSFYQKKTSYKEVDFGYNPDLVILKGDAIFLEGYFQSEKYFIKHEKEIRNDFEVRTPFKKETIDAIEKIESVNSVSIHIRRGDYLSNALHNTNKDEYYNKALEIIGSKVINPVFFIFSDDMDWVKANFTTNHEIVFIDFNDAFTNFEDLILMSACKHNIIANSSFSWWGAWLNNNPDKIVIAPKLWFNDDSINTNDIIPTSWVKI